MPETRKAFKARLQAEGRWGKYLEEREGLKANGTPATLAHSMVYPKYAEPLGVGEVGGIPTVVVSAKGATASNAPTPDVQAVIQQSCGMKKLVPSKIFAGKPPCDARTEVQWVFQNICIEDVVPEQAPSAGAWGLLWDCRNNPAARQDFLRTAWLRLLPSKVDDADAERFTDDGRAIEELIDRFGQAESVLPGSSEGDKGESGIPEKNNEVGVQQQAGGSPAVDKV